MGVPRHSFLIHTMDPSALHCATPLRKIFALFLARENEREHVHKERNFPQAKLDSEVLFFFLNEHGNLYFLLHNSVLYSLIKK